MKKYFYLLIVFCFWASSVYSQAAKSSGASSSGSSQTGFVYYLKYKRHIQYASVIAETYYFTRKDLQIGSKIFDDRIEDKKLINATFILDRKVNKYLSAGLLSFKEFNIRPFQKQVSNIPPPDVNFSIKKDDTLLVVTILYYDSLPRYWHKERHGVFTLFTEARLRISINQDSNILNTKSYYPSFDNDKQPDDSSVTNPYYVFHGEKKGAKAQTIQFLKVYRSNPLLSKSQDSVSNPLPDAYNDAIKDYKMSLYKGAQKGLDLPGSITPDVANKYHYLLNLYRQALDEYNSRVNVQNKTLDELKEKIYDPQLQDKIVENQLQFLKVLYELAAQKVKPPDLPPVNLVDDKVDEVALPINRNDSANNFYFKIIHKSILNQSMYYKSLHYGTWDYGSLTIPFRYRFSRPDAHIITTAGMASNAVSVPEESSITLNLGVYMGRKWGHTRFYENPLMTANTFSFEPVVFAGPTLIALNLSNVDSSSKYIGAANKYTYTGPANIIAWSTGLGMVMQWKTINFGFFGGIDLPFTVQTGWVYAYRPWLGFGIGVNLGILSSGNSVN